VRRVFQLLLAVLCFTPVAGMAADLAQFFQTVQSLRGQFTQVVRDRHGVVVSRGEGRVWLQRPGRFRWDYEKPYHEQIIGKGRVVWLYDPGLSQATRYNITRALGRTPALLLAGRGHLTRLFRVRALPHHKGLHWIKLKPRGRGQGFRWIEIGYLGPRIVRIVVRDGLGQTTAIHLHHVVRNIVVPASLFEFRPPPHTAIVYP